MTEKNVYFIFPTLDMVKALMDYDESYEVIPNRGELLLNGSKTNNYNYSGARFTVQVQHTDAGIVCGLEKFEWVDKGEATFRDASFIAAKREDDLGQNSEVVAGPFTPGQFKPGDASPDGSGLIYWGDANIGGKVQYSGVWIKPMELIKAEQ